MPRISSKESGNARAKVGLGRPKMILGIWHVDQRLSMLKLIIAALSLPRSTRMLKESCKHGLASWENVKMVKVKSRNFAVCQLKMSGDLLIN
jgi:hypothetical protein